MKRLRSFVFWLHLAAGAAAGVIILVMAVTGALLALKPQILNAVDAKVRLVTPPAGGERLGVQALVAAVQRDRPRAPLSAITLQAERTASASVGLGRDTLYVDPYTGRVLGEGSARAQAFFRSVEDWHRWLAVSAEHRVTARGITGASNLAFFFLALSGPYLWWPRSWTWANVRAIVWFRTARTGRARDFNWHNVIGLWCAPVLLVLTFTGVVMSYPWANALLFQLAGSPPPVTGGGGAQPAGRTGEGRGGDGRQTPTPGNLDAVWAQAVAQVPTWRTITARLPARAGGPIAFTIVDARSWNAFARSTLTVDAQTAAVSTWEPYDHISRGQKWRGWVRFGHTGELAGLPGQLIAGLACCGGAMLVWTGLSLALRRLFAWRRFPRRVGVPASPQGARSLSSASE